MRRMTRSNAALCPNAGAAIGEIAARTLEYVNLPADRAQQVGGKQPAKRATDDDSAPFAQPDRLASRWEPSQLQAQACDDCSAPAPPLGATATLA
jgi:hypothetical protein